MTAESTTTTEGESTKTEGEQKQQEQGKTFTEAEVNRIVKERLDQQAKNKFGDYEELKSKAGQTATAEEQIAKLAKDLEDTKTEALRSRIAARFNVSTEPGKNGEPSDADLFLTGTDESTLTAQAQRLAVREGDRKKQGNVAPKEGETKTTGGPTADVREFTRNLFGNTD